MAYRPVPVPFEPSAIPTYLQEELDKIGDALDQVDNLDLATQYVVPARFIAGDMRYADGTSWNPGSGAGLYRFDGVNWEFIGGASKAGSSQIDNGNSTEAVVFATARADANYAVTVTPEGNEFVWVTSKTTAGFTLNRAGTTGDLVVTWTAFPYMDP